MARWRGSWDSLRPGPRPACRISPIRLVPGVPGGRSPHYYGGSGLRGRSGTRGAIASAHSARGRALRGQDDRSPNLTRTCTHMNSRYWPLTGISSPHDGRLCRRGRRNASACTPIFPSAPSPPGGPAASAWKWHPAHKSVQDATTMLTGPRRMGSVCNRWCERGEPREGRRRFRGSSCSPDPPAAAPGCDVSRHVKDGLMVPRMGARSGPAGRLTRASEPDRRLDREPPHGTVFTLGMWYRSRPDLP